MSKNHMPVFISATVFCTLLQLPSVAAAATLVAAAATAAAAVAAVLTWTPPCFS